MIRCWEVSRWTKLQRNYPRLSCVPTRRVITYECRLSMCTFSLWKEHCNVGTDAEFQRVKLDENVNESIASDMKNSNPIITKSQLSGAWIFMTAVHYHNAEPEEIRASEYRPVHPRHHSGISTKRVRGRLKNNPEPFLDSLWYHPFHFTIAH